MENNRGPMKKKSIIGTVVSDKMDKAITVESETRKRHPLYKKFVVGHKKVKARDEKNEAKVGDVVEIVETRPVSREIRWRLVEIIEKSQRG